jgi:hypothetical protein
LKAARITSILAGFFFLGTILGFSQAASQAVRDPWLILADGETGAIHANTTRKDLVRMYGAANVVDEEADVGEGDMETVTTVFPKNPKRSIDILWKDPDKKTAPDSLTIRGCASRWKTAHNISLGMSLKQLEGLNGRPFHLSGLGWDYGGSVLSWSGGTLAPELSGANGHVILRLTCSGNPVTKEEGAAVAPDGDFSSQNPIMQKMNPTVGEIRWVF